MFLNIFANVLEIKVLLEMFWCGYVRNKPQNTWKTVYFSECFILHITT